MDADDYSSCILPPASHSQDLCVTHKVLYRFQESKVVVWYKLRESAELLIISIFVEYEIELEISRN